MSTSGTVDITAAGAGLGSNKFLREQLDPSRYGAHSKPAFARIYGFSYEGAYTPLAKPAIFLVHGEGESAATKSVRIALTKEKEQNDSDEDCTTDIDDAVLKLKLKDPCGVSQTLSLFIGDTSLAPAPTKLNKSGVAAKTWEFASDVRLWEYDRGDFSLRLDIDSGPLERILVDREQGGDEMPYFRGQRTRLRGPGE